MTPAYWLILFWVACILLWAWWTGREFDRFIAEDDRKNAEFDERLKQNKKLRENLEELKKKYK